MSDVMYGAIIGGVVGALFTLALIGVGVYFFIKYAKQAVDQMANEISDIDKKANHVKLKRKLSEWREKHKYNFEQRYRKYVQSKNPEMLISMQSARIAMRKGRFEDAQSSLDEVSEWLRGRHGYIYNGNHPGQYLRNDINQLEKWIACGRKNCEVPVKNLQEFVTQADNERIYH